MNHNYAGFWHRFGGFLLDAIALGTVGTILALIFPQALGSGLGFLVGIGYYVGFNANGGTLGKRAVGLRLQDAATGEDIGYARAVVRYIVALFSVLVLLIGYLWCIWDPQKQTWQDHAALSIVVAN